MTRKVESAIKILLKNNTNVIIYFMCRVKLNTFLNNLMLIKGKELCKGWSELWIHSSYGLFIF